MHIVWETIDSTAVAAAAAATKCYSGPKFGPTYNKPAPSQFLQRWMLVGVFPYAKGWEREAAGRQAGVELW